MTTHIVNYSGGVSSFIVAHHLVSQGIYPMLLFADTLIEDPDLYRFNQETSAFLNIPITRLCDGRTPWQVFEDEKFIGNTRIDPCSKILKRQLLSRFIEDIAEHDHIIAYYGIDWSEQHRFEKLKSRCPYEAKAPLCDELLLTKNQQIELCQRLGIRPPRLYSLGFAHNNCGGFCIKAGQGQFWRLQQALPEVYAWHEQKEQAARQKIGDNAGAFIRIQDKGKTEYYTMKQFRQLKEKQVDMFDIGGCGCIIGE